MIRHVAATITRSRALKEVLVSHGAAADRIQVLYNGVDATRFHPMPRAASRKALGLSEDDLVLVYVGRLSPEKGVSDLVAALAHLRDRHQLTPRLLVVGDGPQRAALQRQAGSLGVDGQIQWAGTRANHELAPFYTAADVACVPSLMEGVPNAALEALACGIPVVGTRVGGIPEVLTTETGVLVDPQQPQQFAEALATALRQSWDHAAIVTHSRQFSWDTNARTLFDLLKQATAGIPQGTRL